MEKRDSLFRDEVIENRNSGLFGEIVLNQPLSTYLYTAGLFIIISAACLWVLLGSYARIETVPGILVTSKPSAKIQVLAEGIIGELSVQEGQYVQKGKHMATLKLDRATEDGSAVAASGLTAIDAQTRLAQEQISVVRQRSRAEANRVKTNIRTAQTQAQSLANQINLQKEAIASNQSIYDQLSKIVDRGFVSKFEYERRRQDLLSSKQALANLEQQYITRVTEASQGKAKLSSLPVETQGAITSIKSNMQQLLQQKAQVKGQRAERILAPISGVVTNLQTATGRVASPGQPIMSIVPKDAILRAQLYAPSRAIGFVSKGDEVRILYDAFPYQRFGSYPATVESVSRIVIDPREASIPIQLEEAVYKIQVTLDAQSISAFGKNIPLQAGMSLQANIVLERQSFLDWLLAPLNAVLKRAS